MALKLGARLGIYEVLAPVGAGGMGEVYRARDTRLNRDVAIKVLPEAIAADADRLARFQREAQILASLNHPNIADIHGLEVSSGIHALVMELVEGETLAERVRTGPLPMDEVLLLARQIAEALEAAHEKGIIHRDLKPANVKITPEGTVKVLDFGLAKVQEPAERGQPADGNLSQQPTEMAPTQAGVILGTAAYMSPEQARGKPVGKPTDIWAFGCVLYEMIAGRKAFRGDTSSDLIAAILKAEPDWSALPDSVPEAIRRLLRRCFQKDPARRLHHFADVRLEIEEAIAAPPTVQSSGRPASSAKRAAVVAGMLVALLAGVAAGSWWSSARSAAVPDWEGTTLGGLTVAMRPHVSPDGNMLSFQAMVDGLTQVAVMKPETGNWRVLTRDRTRGLVEDTCWSRDGTRIYFSRYLDAPGGVFSVPVLGGDERLVLEDALAHHVLPDGSLLVSRINADRRLQLHRFWPQTGDLKPLGAILWTRSGFTIIGGFRDGKEAVFVGKPPQAPADSPDHLYAMDLSSGQVRRLAPTLTIAALRDAWPLAVARDDRAVLLIIPQGDLRRIVAVPRDGGPSLRVVATLTMRPYGLDVGPDGSLYVDQAQRPAEITRFTSSGTVDQRMALPSTYGSGQALPLPDGRILMWGAGSKRVLLLAPGKDPVPFVDTDEDTSGPMAQVSEKAVAFMAGAGPNRTLVIASLGDGRILRRLKGVSGNDVKTLAASPDGQTVYYVSAGFVWAIPAGDGTPRKVHAGDGVAVDPQGQSLIVSLNEKTGAQLVRVPIAGGADEPVRVRDETRLVLESFAPNAVGPDGRIAVMLAPKDSWFWPAAVLDPKTGQVERLSTGYDVDMSYPGWTSDGHIVTWSTAFSPSIWRLRPITRIP